MSRPVPRAMPKPRPRSGALPGATSISKGERARILRGYNPTQDVRLSFDDCATAAHLRQILILLRQDKVEAIFFFTGLCMQQNPGYRAEVLRSHQLLGNHSFDHKDYSKLTDAQITAELLKGVKPTTSPMLARPPYGALAFTVRFYDLAAKVGMRPCFWTVDTRDWDGYSADRIIHRVLVGESGPKGTPPAKAGGLVLMHGTGEHTLEALPDVISGIRHKHLVLFPLR
ncbi:MAG: hypothetical protein JWM40_2998 [Frankiales bacterium]|nr:hypothetical protein [Frankiales bacterium]